MPTMLHSRLSPGFSVIDDGCGPMRGDSRSAAVSIAFASALSVDAAAAFKAAFEDELSCEELD
jgi:hypothetical protein